MKSYCFAILLNAFGIRSHMQMVEPAPRNSQYNKGYKGTVDYDMVAPLGPEKPFPCRGFKPGPPVETVNGGSSIHVKIQGGASHNGGHCQFAISFDDNKFVVLKTVMDDCLTGSGLEFDVPVPSSAPSSEKATFAWTWINKTGNREYYMNCADIKIEGQQGGSLKGPELLVANLPSYPTIGEFTNSNANDGKQMFDSRKTITISPSGGSKDGSQSYDQGNQGGNNSTIPSADSAPSKNSTEPETNNNDQKPDNYTGNNNTTANGNGSGSQTPESNDNCPDKAQNIDNNKQNYPQQNKAEENPASSSPANHKKPKCLPKRSI